MTRPLRIAIGGFHIESSTFTPYISGEADFLIRRGDELLARYAFLGERATACARAETRDARDVEWLPLVHGRALPGGVVSRAFYLGWKEEFLAGIRAQVARGGLDGVFLDIHGACSVEGALDVEGDLAQEVRGLVGPSTFMSAAMDLHGNVSESLFAATDYLTCYRTAPHIDAEETRQRAVNAMIAALEHRRPVFSARVAVPILLPGEKTSTEVEPGRSLYGSIPGVCTDTGATDVAIWMGFPWADQPRCHGAVVASAQTAEAARSAALQVARDYWSRADEFDFVGPAATMEDAARAALRSPLSPYFLSDTGDNPGAGGTGNSTAFLRVLHGEYVAAGSRKRVLFASLFSPEAIADARAAGLSGNVALAVGPRDEDTLNLSVETFFEDPMGGLSAVLSEGEFRVVVTSARVQYGTADHFKRTGHPLGSDDIVTVKMGYLEPELSSAAQDWTMALSPGAVDQDLPRLPFHLLKRPLVPFDPPTFDPQLEVTLRSWRPGRDER